VLLSFKFFAARDDFPNGIANFALWGRLINLRTDCQSVPPGNARPRPRPSRVWLRPQAALGSSVAQVLSSDFFVSLFGLPAREGGARHEGDRALDLGICQHAGREGCAPTP